MSQLDLDFHGDNIPCPRQPDGTGPTCFYCGQERYLDIHEFWSEDRAWMFDTCCEGSHEEACWEVEHDPRGFGKWFEERTGWACRQGYASDSEMALRLDFGLQLADIPQAEAKDFVRAHHRHCPPPAGWRWGHAVYNGRELVAVAMVGRPVARQLDANTTVEVNRLCVNPDLDPELVWNACSMLYAAAAKEAKRRGYERIVTYTLESESGKTLVAVGWTPTVKTKGGTWNRRNRQRTDKTSICRKQRWERSLKRGRR